MADYRKLPLLIAYRRKGGLLTKVDRPSVTPALSRGPAAPRLRRERVFCAQGLERAGCRIKSGMTEDGKRLASKAAGRPEGLGRMTILRKLSI